MEFSELIELLKVTLKTPLTVNEQEDVLNHFIELKGKQQPLEGIRKSGVLLFFYPKDNIPHILLIKRSTYKGAHSGQISFPGGKAEPEDTSITATALREAREEVAIVSPHVIGTLTDVYVPVSKFNITPVVGYKAERPSFIPEEREVDAIIEFPVAPLLQSPFFEYGQLSVSQQMKIKTYYFKVGEHVVWGATAMIIAELRSYLLRSYSPR